MLDLTAPSGKLRWGLVTLSVVAGLLAIFWIGFQLRMQGMYPATEALLYETDYDEGVNIAAGQLWLQGFVPYRDYMFAHPPLAVFILAGVLETHFVPWGDATAFVYERYAAITCGLLVIFGVFVLAGQLGGTLSGLVAAGLLAVDGLVVEIDRRAMLEPYLNAFSILAVLCYLLAYKRERSRAGWLLAAGAFGAGAMLVKTVGALVLAALLLYAGMRLLVVFLQTRVQHGPASGGDSIRKRLGELAQLATGAAVTAIAILGYFLITNPVSFVRQVYLFQLVRPADGPASVAERLSQILGADTSHLTVYVAGAGVAILVLRGLLRRNWGQWGLVLIWTASIVALLTASRTFYPHYYVQLAVPLSILGGGLVSREWAGPGRAPDEKNPAHATSRIVLGAEVALCLALLATNWGPAQTQYARAQAVSTFQSTRLRDISRVLSTRTSPSGRILVFHPAYALAASRELVGPGDGQFLIDSYGYMQYVGMGLDGDWAPDPSSPGVMDLLHGEEAQARIREIAARADYILLEQRAGWQLNPETITAITNGYHLIYTKGQFSLWAKS